MNRHNGSASGDRCPARPPIALLHLHLARTGGTTVRGWAAANAGNGHLFDRAHGYTCAARCFAQQHSDLLGVATTPRRCPRDLDWRSMRLAVEFHGDSFNFFLRTVLPQLPALRRRYEEACGMLLAVTTVREPVSHLFSVYHFAPPRLNASAPVGSAQMGLTAFPAWMGRAEGLQTAMLSGYEGMPRDSGYRLGMVNRLPRERLCGDVAARAVLAELDVVGVTSCVELLIAHLESRLRRVAAPDVSHRAGDARPRGGANASIQQWRSDAAAHGAGRHGRCASAAARHWGWDVLAASEQLELLRLTRCDFGLYVDAARRATSMLGRACQPPLSHDPDSSAGGASLVSTWRRQAAHAAKVYQPRPGHCRG